MAVIALTPSVTSRTGLVQPVGQAVAAADTAEFENTGTEILRVVWGGVPGNLGVVTQLTSGANPSHAVADDSIAFSGGQVQYLGPYPTGEYNRSADNKVVIDPDQPCTVAVLRPGSLS